MGRFTETGQNEPDLILGFTGYPIPYRSLYQSVLDASVAIAVRTPNPPPDDNAILFEVTALSPPETLKQTRSVNMSYGLKVNRDALMVASGFTKAIILPQTAVSKQWNQVELLGECCTAAGLMADAWLTKASPEIGLYRFETQIFRETSTEKTVKEINLEA